MQLQRGAETHEERLGYLQSAIEELLKAGVTCAHPCEKDTWAEFVRLYDDQRLPIRIAYCTYGMPVFGEEAKDHKEAPFFSFPETHDDHRGDMLHVGRLKFFADGALGAHTAALSLPYRRQGSYHDNQQDNEEENKKDKKQDNEQDEKKKNNHSNDHGNRCVHVNRGIMRITEVFFFIFPI